MFDFLKEAIQSPKTIGAIAPSSSRLANMMAQRAVADRPAVIVEVGAGDGAITQALLRARHPETTLLICEQNPVFQEALAKLLADETNVELFIGDIQNCPKEWYHQAGVLVSGLPFASFPLPLRHELLETFQTLLQPGGHFIAFQYTKLHFKTFRRYFFEHSYSYTLQNMPPAYVFEGVQKEDLPCPQS